LHYPQDGILSYDDGFVSLVVDDALCNIHGFHINNGMLAGGWGSILLPIYVGIFSPHGDYRLPIDLQVPALNTLILGQKNAGIHYFFDMLRAFDSKNGLFATTRLVNPPLLTGYRYILYRSSR
jgi:hypothetical protein